MNTHNLWRVVTLAAVLVPRVAVAQHEAHQAGGPQAAAEVAQCARVQPVVNNIISAAMGRLETARQSNNPTEMRAAVDHLEAALRDIRTQLAPCSAAAAATDPHAGHTMPSTKQPTGTAAPATQPQTPLGAAEPHAGHSTTGKAPADVKEGKVMDPVTGLMVDPATAPRTTYQGQTYHFSSELSRKEFLANPAKFAKKPKG